MYTYGLRQQGAFVTRAFITFEPFEGCSIVITSEYGWSNYFGNSASMEPLRYLTKKWAVPCDPNNEDWQTLNEIFSRKPPTPLGDPPNYSLNIDESYRKGSAVYHQTKNDLFYKERDKDIETYIDSKLGWR